MKLAVFASLLMILTLQAEASSCFGRRVIVWVTSGKNLGDGLLSPDPYVVVKIGGESKKTKVAYSTSNPGWMQELEFPEATSDMITMEVWDRNAVASDEKLGTCMEPLVHHGQRYETMKCVMNNNNGDATLMYRCL